MKRLPSSATTPKAIRLPRWNGKIASFPAKNTGSHELLFRYIGEDRLPNKIGGSQGSIQFHTFTPTTGRAGHSIGLRLQAVRREDATLPIKCRARIPEIGYDNVVGYLFRTFANFLFVYLTKWIAGAVGVSPTNIGQYIRFSKEYSSQSVI